MSQSGAGGMPARPDDWADISHSMDVSDSFFRTMGRRMGAMAVTSRRALAVYLAFIATVAILLAWETDRLPTLVVAMIGPAVFLTRVFAETRKLTRSIAAKTEGPRPGDRLTVTLTATGVTWSWRDQSRSLDYWMIRRVESRFGMVLFAGTVRRRAAILPAEVVPAAALAEIRRRVTWWREHPAMRPARPHRPSRSPGAATDQAPGPRSSSSSA